MLLRKRVFLEGSSSDCKAGRHVKVSKDVVSPAGFLMRAALSLATSKRVLLLTSYTGRVLYRLSSKKTCFTDEPVMNCIVSAL